MSARHFKWLPNALTVSRALFAVPILLYTASENWEPALLLMVIALGTDFFDGLAAKKLNAQTKLGGILDLLSDFLLAAAGVLGLAIAGLFPWWGVVLLGVWSLLVAYERWFWHRTSLLHALRPRLSVAVTFSVWTYTTLMLATQAYGWSWWYVVLTIGLLGFSAMLKRHRLRAWWHARKSIPR